MRDMTFGQIATLTTAAVAILFLYAVFIAHAVP